MITVSRFAYVDENEKETGEQCVCIAQDGSGELGPWYMLLSAAQARDFAVALVSKANAIDPVN